MSTSPRKRNKHNQSAPKQAQRSAIGQTQHSLQQNTRSKQVHVKHAGESNQRFGGNHTQTARQRHTTENGSGYATFVQLKRYLMEGASTYACDMLLRLQAMAAKRKDREVEHDPIQSALTGPHYDLHQAGDVEHLLQVVYEWGDP
jgi:hypothetical protein